MRCNRETEPLNLRKHLVRRTGQRDPHDYSIADSLDRQQWHGFSTGRSASWNTAQLLRVALSTCAGKPEAHPFQTQMGPHTPSTGGVAPSHVAMCLRVEIHRRKSILHTVGPIFPVARPTKCTYTHSSEGITSSDLLRGAEMTAGGQDNVREHGQQIIIDLRESAEVVALAPKAVPFLDLPQQHAALETEILTAWRGILLSAAFVGGSAVESFENSLATYLDVNHVVGVANGTDAIMLALKALGIKEGDEVITAANTFFATAEAITHAGGTPVLVDVRSDTATISPEAVRAAITPRTRAIVPVHLYGQPADMDEIMKIAAEHHLVVVEDNAQAIGAQYRGQMTGTIGHAGATSFYPGKNLGATGDAGAVTTDDPEVARRVRTLANHGLESKHNHIDVGYNSRLDALQAVALSIKLNHLDDWNQRRGLVADRYKQLIDHSELIHPVIAGNRSHVYHLYVVRVRNRDELIKNLASRGISTGLHYPTPIHLTQPYGHLGNGAGSFPVAERWASEGVSLPMFPEMTEEQTAAVAGSITELLEKPHVLTRTTA